MTKLQQFFHNNAAYSYNPATQTEEQGRIECAVALAAAAHHALDAGWVCEWNADTDEPCNCGQRNCGHTVEYCQLWDGDTMLASLSGICGASDEYRRVVEAELALEAIG